LGAIEGRIQKKKKFEDRIKKMSNSIKGDLDELSIRKQTLTQEIDMMKKKEPKDRRITEFFSKNPQTTLNQNAK
jgi:hypothetical protein